MDRLDELIGPLVTARAPGLLARHGVGPDTAALLLVAAGDHPERLRSESSWAHLCGRRPDPGRLRQGRRPVPAQPRRQPRSQPGAVADRDHPDEVPSGYPRLRRAAHQGRPVEEEIIRCLKRYVAREVYCHLRDGA
jgi:transposase